MKMDRRVLVVVLVIIALAVAFWFAYRANWFSQFGLDYSASHAFQKADQPPGKCPTYNTERCSSADVDYNRDAARCNRGDQDGCNKINGDYNRIVKYCCGF